MKKYVIIFLVAFAVNFVWEHLHSALYSGFYGGEITNTILFGATLLDALFISGLAFIFINISYFRRRLWLAIIFGMVAGIVTEVFAISLGFWSYNSVMPLVPILQTGVTPSIQLGLLSFLTYSLVLPQEDLFPNKPSAA